MSELPADNTRFVTIDMSNTADIKDAEMFISEYRTRGMVVVQRSLVYDKSGTLWCVIFMEKPLNVPEPEITHIHVACDCKPHNVHTVEPVLELHARGRLNRGAYVK